jgi:hypothetical protein
MVHGEMLNHKYKTENEFGSNLGHSLELTSSDLRGGLKVLMISISIIRPKMGSGKAVPNTQRDLVQEATGD